MSQPAIAISANDIASPETRTPSLAGSERALDAAAFCLADVADGLGPFLVIYFTSQRHWSAGEAGTAMSLMLLGTVLSQTFIGAWIDRTRSKRMAVAVAAVFVAMSSIAMYHLPNYLPGESREATTIDDIVGTSLGPRCAKTLAGQWLGPGCVVRTSAVEYLGSVALWVRLIA